MRAFATAGIAALLLAASPALAQQLNPYDQGIAARLGGDTARAVILLEEAVRREPKNADAQLQLGLSLMAADRLDEAETSLKRALELAPDYQDAKDALARLAQWRAVARVAAFRWQLDLDGNYSILTHAEPDWFDGKVQLHHKLGDTAVTGTIEPSRRFGVTDIYSEVRIDQRLGAGTNLWASLGGTRHADFRPQWQASLGGSARLSSGPFATVMTAEGRYARYSSGNIQTLTPGIEQYVGGGSWLTARFINVFGRGHHMGWLARGDWMASPRVRLFAGAANAPDTSEGVVTRVFSVFGGISADVSERTSLRLSITHENRDGPLSRTEVGIGMGYRF